MAEVCVYTRLRLRAKSFLLPVKTAGPTRLAVVLVVACAVLLQNPSADCFSGSIRRNPGTPSRASDRFVAGSLQTPGARAQSQWDPVSRPQAPFPRWGDLKRTR